MPRQIGDPLGPGVSLGGVPVVEASGFDCDSATLLATPSGADRAALTFADKILLGQTLTFVDNTSATLLSYSNSLALVGATAALIVVDVGGTWTQSLASGVQPALLLVRPIVTGLADTLPSLRTSVHNPTYVLQAQNTIIADDVGFLANPAFSAQNSGSVLLVAHTGLVSRITVNSGITLSTRTGLNVNARLGTGVIGTDIGVDIATLVASTQISLRSQGGGAQLRHAGSGVFGANAAPTNSYCGLELQSTTKAFMLPRMTIAQRDAMTPLDGMMVYITNAGSTGVNARINGAWISSSL